MSDRPPASDAPPVAYYGSAYANPWQQAPKKRSRLTIWLIALGSVVGVLLVGAIVAGVVHRQSDRNVYSRTTITMPDTLAGLHKASGTAADSVTDLASNIPFPTPPLSGLYLKPDGVRAAVLFVGKVRLDSAQEAQELNDAEGGFHDSQKRQSLSPTSFRDVAPGALGGKVRCSTWTLKSVRLTSCFFVDAAVFGAAVIPSPDADSLAVTLREGVEHRR